jgi:hypothetical protein
MTKPRLFIGSSREGLYVAETVFESLRYDTDPTIWTHEVFTLNATPMEALERELRRHTFAILVASPDDEIIKRGVSAPTMRDNVLFEFGLFTGALGRNRAFFLCPDQPKLELPSDLLGVTMAVYDAARAKLSSSDRAAALQRPSRQIRDAINDQWVAMQEEAKERETRIRASNEAQAVRRLLTVATEFRNVLMVLQRDSITAFSDREAFEKLKRRSTEKVAAIALGFMTDAKTINVETELDLLRSATNAALLALPFPEELAPGREAVRNKAIEFGIGTLNAFLKGDNPVDHVNSAARAEASGWISDLSTRYGEWWREHSPRLQEATTKMYDALMSYMLRVVTKYAAGAEIPVEPLALPAAATAGWNQA